MAYTLHKNITTVNRTVLSKKTNKYIVIHYTGNKTDKASSNASYFKSVNRGASAHYFVDATTVYQVVEDKDAAWAVGKKYGETKLFDVVKNNNSISIEMCSTNGAISDATFNNTVELTKKLMKKYNIPASNVYRHFDVSGGKLCPGWKGWVGEDTSIWKKFKSKLVPTTTPTPTKKAYTGTFPVGTLKRGSKGTQVTNLQKFLKWCGYSIDVDSSFGSKTETIVKQYQKDYGLTVDGIWGAKSLAKAKTIKK